jgi:hypothetical protein
MTRDSDSPVATKVAAGAPEADIEITPEMIEAGVVELALFSCESSSHIDTVVDIFVAMESAKLKNKDHQIA